MFLTGTSFVLHKEEHSTDWEACKEDRAALLLLKGEHDDIYRLRWPQL